MSKSLAKKLKSIKSQYCPKCGGVINRAFVEMSWVEYCAKCGTVISTKKVK